MPFNIPIATSEFSDRSPLLEGGLFSLYRDRSIRHLTLSHDRAFDHRGKTPDLIRVSVANTKESHLLFLA
jgi:hypothetical protein